uniref:Cell differentiation protein rcd1 n=1 Tax=Neobodo designis TaxID=312471 RepID=A0A7S1LX70_NEODS|mmetsp:Transcript_30088/g.92825  ORF Transcript_30088/g.92825 Transcript_30088/m.92825 type:complete len:309 (+) Transcript_30088:93-1019(+)
MATPPPQQQQQPASPQQPPELAMLLRRLLQDDNREQVLIELSKNREAYPELAPVLWYTPGCVAVLLQELVSIYPSLNPPALQVAASNRVCNALALVQTIASHPETRLPFLNAHVPLYLYPFLNTHPQSSEKPFEYLRLTSLGVIGALVKTDDNDVVKFLLGTEIVPLCLKIMEKGTELSKTVATFIVQKVLAHDLGLNYVCATPERFKAVADVLRQMVQDHCPQRLLRHVIRCYLRLTEHPRAKDALKQCLPNELKNNTFAAYFKDDANMCKWLGQLLTAVEVPGAHQLIELAQKQQAAQQQAQQQHA